MRPRGENIAYDKLRDRCDVLAAELAARRDDLGRLEHRYRRLDATTSTRIETLEAALRYIGKACDLSDDETDVGITYRNCFPAGTEEVP